MGDHAGKVRPSEMLREIRDQLAALRRLEESRQRVEDGTPLSLSEICRLLHIDKKSTLWPLIRAKKVRTVPWTRGELRVPVAELRRLQREGIPAIEEKKPGLPASRRVGPGPASREVAAGIRGLKIK